MKILVRGIVEPHENKPLLTPIYQWCRTQAEMFKVIRRILKEGLDTIIINRVNDDVNYIS